MGSSSCGYAYSATWQQCNAYRDRYRDELLRLFLVKGFVVEHDEHVVAELLHQALGLVRHLKLVLMGGGNQRRQHYEYALKVGQGARHGAPDQRNQLVASM